MHKSVIIVGYCGIESKINKCTLKMTEAVAQRCLIQKVFLKTPQNSQQNLCVGASFLKKWQVSGRKALGS